MKRLVLGFVLLVGGGVAAVWFAWPALTERLRVRLERELSQAADTPSRLATLGVSIVPPHVEVGGIAVGAESPIARIGRIDARLHALASLLEWRLVLGLRIESVAVDLTHPATSAPATEARPAAPSRQARLPPLQLVEFDLKQAQLRFRMGKDAAQLTVGHLAAHLETALVGAGLTAGVEASDVEFERKSHRAKIYALRADGGADAGGLFVHTASLEGDGISVSARETLLPHRHTAAARFTPGILGVVVDELAFIGGDAQVEGTLIGDLANPTLDGRLVIRHGTIGQHVLGDLDTHVARYGATLRFDDLRLTGIPGAVTGGLELSIVHDVPIHGDLTWHDVDLEAMLRSIGPLVPFSNRFSAHTAVHGALDPLDLDVAGTGIVQTTDPRSPKDVARFELSARVLPHDLDAKLDLTQPERNHVAAEVVIKGSQFAGTLSLQAADLAALNALLPRPVPRLALTGQGAGSAEFSGTTEHPVVGGVVALRDLTALGTPVSQLKGDFSIAAQTLATKSAQIETATGSAELSGVLALDARADNDWRLSVHDLDTDLVLGLVRGLSAADTPLSGGTLNGTFACRGPWARVETRAELTARSLHIANEPLERVDVQATTVLPHWSGRVHATHAAGETVTVEAEGEAERASRVTIRSTPTDLANWRGAGRRRLTGIVAVDGQFSGPLRQPSGVLQLSGTGLGAGGHYLGNLALRAEANAGDWALKGTAFADTLALNATLRSAGPLPYTLAVTWRDSNLTALVSEDPSLQIITTGELHLIGAWRALETTSGSLRVTRFEMHRDQGRVEAPQPIEIQLDNGRFRITALELSAHGSRVSVAGEGRLPADLALEVRGEGDLVLLEVIGRPFYSSRGQFGIAAHVGHSQAGGWTLRGHAELRNAALDLGLPVAFTDTSGNFTLLGSRVVVDSLTGKAGGGDFSVLGRVHLNRGPALAWTLREVAFTVPEWLEERASGKGQLQGTWQVMTVSGDIEVLSALYDKRLELTALLPWFKEQIAPAPRRGPAATEVRLDLRIHAPDGLFVDNNFAKAEMAADLRLIGTADNPRLSGTVEILNGEVTVGARVFTITGGSAVFQDPERINPVLNLNAESQISTPEAEYTVRVAVSGTADSPRVQFSSDDPSLSQNEVLSLVTLGKTTREAQRESGGVSVGDVLSLLPHEYTGDVSQQVRTLFRVDRFEVDPAYVRTTGAIEPRVTIGKDITDRIRALASSSFGVDARNTMQLEYRITGRISLLGTWESATQSQAGAFAGDIKFRYEFRRVPFSLLPADTDLFQRSDAQ